ncbi:MAG: hypothetical protein LC808_03170, partial [Actinobacteria bacterium]|nr:hypothetical protein [Actinomycetota bacterium]
MTRRVVWLRDMAHAAVIDAELEHLLAGNPSAGDPLSEDLSLMISQLAEAFPEPTISGDIAEIHIAKIVETAATESQPIAPGRNGLGARLGAILSPPATRIAAFGLVLTTSFSGMAYAGVLPDQLQRSTAALGRMVGIELPDPGIANDDVGRPGEAERPPYMHLKDDGLGKRVIREDGATSSRSDDRSGNGDPSGENEGPEGYGGGGDDSVESGGSSGDVEGAG